MINATMHKLKYSDPPQYKSYQSYREYLRNVSNHSCAYCTITENESPGATFVIEHFRPQSLFPSLTTVCINLRYSCPRCNSYKGNLWIKKEAGCIRNCTACKTKACSENVERFIDSLNDDPSEKMYLGDDDLLHAYSGSKDANYTIEYLRLNRAQLIKLRHIRRFMDSWSEELKIKREENINYKDSIYKKKDEFERSLKETLIKSGSKDEVYTNMVITMYDMLITQSEQTILMINEELRKINYLMSSYAGHKVI